MLFCCFVPGTVVSAIDSLTRTDTYDRRHHLVCMELEAFSLNQMILLSHCFQVLSQKSRLPWFLLWAARTFSNVVLFVAQLISSLLRYMCRGERAKIRIKLFIKYFTKNKLPNNFFITRVFFVNTVSTAGLHFLWGCNEKCTLWISL